MVFPTDIISIISEYANNLLVKHFYVVREEQSKSGQTCRKDLSGEFIYIKSNTKEDTLYDVKPCVYYRNDLLNPNIQFIRYRYLVENFLDQNQYSLSNVFTSTIQPHLNSNDKYKYHIRLIVNKISEEDFQLCTDAKTKLYLSNLTLMYMDINLSDISKKYIKENLHKSKKYIKKFTNNLYTRILSDFI